MTHRNSPNPCGGGRRPLYRAAVLVLLAVLSLAFHGQARAQTDDPPPDTVPHSDPAMRWWDALTPEQRLAIIRGDAEPTPEQIAASESAYADLEMDDRSLINNAVSLINGEIEFSSVGSWWQSLAASCSVRRIAVGDGNTDDPESPYCAHYPGSGRTPLLGAEAMERVDRIGLALLGRTDVGVYPADWPAAMGWWNALEPAQRVAVLHGDSATPEQRAVAERIYEDMDPEAKRLVHNTVAEIVPFGTTASVGAWWEGLDCREKRIAAGEGNTEDLESPYCKFYPGSGETPLLGDDERNHVDRLGQALLELMEPGVYPPDIIPAMNWWEVLEPDQRVRALHGTTATPEEDAAARNDYADLDPQTKRRVNNATAQFFGAGLYASVGAWWQSLDCRLRRVAAGDGNTEDPDSRYCAHYPGSRLSPVLDDMAREHVNRVGMAVFGLSEPGLYPSSRTRVEQVTRVLLPAVTRAALSNTVDAVSSRVNARLSGSGRNAVRLNLAGTEVAPGLRSGPARERNAARPDAPGAEAAPPHALALPGQAIRGGSTEFARLLARSSFILPLNGPGNPGGMTLWGSGDFRDVAGAGDGVDWEGIVVSGHMGSDVLLRRDLLAGLALSWSRSILDYTERFGLEPRGGDYETDLVSINPYAGWTLRSGVRLWALAGHGWGRVRVYHDDAIRRHSSDITQWSAALGASGTLYSVDDRKNGQRTALDLKAEGSLARAEIHGSDDMDEFTATVNRLRLAVTGTHSRRIMAGSVLTPSLEVGVLADGGAGQTGAGLEVGGGVKLARSELGLTLEGRGRALLAHGGDAEEWSVGGTVHLDPGVSGQGWSVRLAPSWGLPRSRPEDLWQRGLAEGGRPVDAARRVTGELGYGFTAFGERGLVTPYAGFVLSGHGAQEYRAGTRVRVAPSLALALQGARRRQPDASVQHGLTVRASIHW